jgi:hypothetical protein
VYPVDGKAFVELGKRLVFLDVAGNELADNQEPGRKPLAICKDAQQRKQFRAALDFIDNYQSPERA